MKSRQNAINELYHELVKSVPHLTAARMMLDAGFTMAQVDVALRTEVDAMLEKKR